jgi:hypothetical protein
VPSPLTFARLRERGAALGAWEGLGGSTARLVWLDGRIRRGTLTDFPGRPAGPEPRTVGEAGAAPPAA